ncbi:MAG: poly-gamma-glutamate system protein [Myxococcales bacterium]|nr:MAG: poly-gamma-glutamate system protein [Myxococcales bacterium]
MKNLYWRSQRISRTALTLIAIGSCLSLMTVEHLKERVKKPDYGLKIHAARLTKQAFDAILDERKTRRLPVQTYNDPAGSGLIGDLMSEATTNYGSLSSKRTSVNPNFAAVMVHYLRDLGVRPGDVVAVGYSGSFPAINIATLAAIQTLKLNPLLS